MELKIESNVTVCSALTENSSHLQHLTRLLPPAAESFFIPSYVDFSLYPFDFVIDPSVSVTYNMLYE
jgi:hypothetical protein